MVSMKELNLVLEMESVKASNLVLRKDSVPLETYLELEMGFDLGWMTEKYLVKWMDSCLGFDSVK